MRTTRLTLIVLIFALVASTAPAPGQAYGAVAYDSVLQLHTRGVQGDYQMPASVAVARLDSEPGLDAAVGASSKVYLFSGDRKRGLRPSGPIHSIGFDEVAQVVAAGFNADGRTDLAVVSLGAFGGKLVVLMAQPDGSFEPRKVRGLGELPAGMAAGDVDRDGSNDLVVATFDGVELLLGDGSGGFSAPTTLFEVPNPAALDTADLDRDSDLDIAAVDEDGELYVALGDGGGGFAPLPAEVFESGSVDSLTVGDVSGDSAPDIVVGADGRNPSVVLVGDGSGAFVPQPPPPSPILSAGSGRGPDAIELADTDMDGRLDLVSSQEDLTAGSFSVARGNGSGRLSAPVSFSAHMGPSAVAVADFAGSDRPDVLAANYYDALSVSLYTAGGRAVECNREDAEFVGQERGDVEAFAAGGRVRRPAVNDALFMTERSEVVATGAGSDVVSGRGDSDTLCAGSGNDRIGGGVGDDVLMAGDGDDKLNGGPGEDLCVGGPGQDGLKSCERVR